MNEIKKIHLGRQPFTIAVDAHKLLRSYLDEIEQQLGDKSEVIQEIELRMAELLAERGITGDKVVLLDDVIFLKEQLGEPGDFKDEDEASDKKPKDESQNDAPRRLYRDTQHGMIAGVASGIAAYFGIDATIVRLIFIVALFAGGSAIPIYIILWLVTPEANSPSERLQMQGKAVTVDSLKEFVDRADVKGAANRASKAVGPVFERIAKVISATIGSIFVVIAAALFMALSAATAYLFTHHHDLIAHAVPFPVGNTENLFTAMCAVVGAIISLFILLLGLAMIRGKWLVSGWITASLFGLLLIAGAVGTAVGPDTVYGVRDRYQAAEHTSLQKVDAFTSVKIKGHDVDFVYEKSNTYEVGLKYLGNYDAKQLKTSVKDGVLTIDASQIKNKYCDGFCIADAQFNEVVIRAPKLDHVTDDTQAVWGRFQSGEQMTTGEVPEPPEPAEPTN